ELAAGTLTGPRARPWLIARTALGAVGSVNELSRAVDPLVLFIAARVRHATKARRRPLIVAAARTKQQPEEHLALEQLRPISGLLPGRDSRGADPPDFIITNGIHFTSVEMTAFHRGSEERGGSKAAGDESNAQQLVERAQAILERDNPDLHVEVRPYL